MLRVLSNIYVPAEHHLVRTFGNYLPPGAAPWRPEKERRNLAAILPLIPQAEKPDALIIASPEYLPIPFDVASFPGLRILLITDWNMCLRYLPDLCKLFDFCFVDWSGYRLLRRAGVANVHHQPLFGHDPADFAFRDLPRNLDVSFCGNLNAGMHRERNRLLARLAKWGVSRSLRLGQAFGDAYVDTLNRSRLVFNYSIRGEANMRLFEAMACGAVPLVEAGNQEVPMLFQPDRHYFSYDPERLEERLESLLADPARIEAAAREARLAVAQQTKAKQIRSLLDFAGRELPIRTRADIRAHEDMEAHDGLGADREVPTRQGMQASEDLWMYEGPRKPAPPDSLKALMKTRVLGADYTLAEAISELQEKDAVLPGLAAETLPAALLTLLEDNPRETLAAAEVMLERLLDPPGMPEPVRAFFRMRLHALRGRWSMALEASLIGLRALDAMEADGFPPIAASSIGSGSHQEPVSHGDPYAFFYPHIGLGRGITTDLNRAFKEDLETGSHRGYLGLMRAQCMADRAAALLALDRPGEALACVEGIPGDRFVSLDPYRLLHECCLRLGDDAGLRRVLQAWFAERPLDSAVWDKMAEGLDRLGDRAGWIAFMEEILILGRHFLQPAQAETLRALLESRRAQGA